MDDKFNEREKIIYEPSYNEHIINSEIYLTETTLKVSLELDELYDDFIISNPPFLENNLKKQYSSQLYNRENLEKTSIFNFEFEISKYDENIDTFYLTIPINEEVIIRIELNKK